MMNRTRTVVDEIMQQETRPLLAEDVVEPLHRQFALLSGGRGKGGTPIITFPEFPGFNDLPDEDIRKVVAYLTSIPSPDVASGGFIGVVDRRRDKWSSVKPTLARLAGAFPGNLQLVLVLRPSRFIQRAIADISSRFHREDFKMKVVMLNSASDLHGYIDRAQLTRELGGSLQYCHKKWVQHRMAIESFAVTVKTTAQRLQHFGTELAETRLPRDVQGSKNLLASHSQEHHKLKDELKRASKQGETLLSCIEEQAHKTASGKLYPDEAESLTTVERLLAQLDETETSFEQFWSKHQLKLQHCVQLRQFEQDYREVKASLDSLMERQSAFSDIGDSVVRVEQLLVELKALEESAQEYLLTAQRLTLLGNRLIGLEHFDTDSIRRKCAELGRASDDFTNEAKRQHDLLMKSLDIHTLIDKVNRWSQSGVNLLASQAVDKCQSQEGAQAALLDVQRFLESALRDQLFRLRDLHDQGETSLAGDVKIKVQKTLERLEEVQEMFEKRQASLKRLSAKQTRPVQPVAPNPDSTSKRSKPPWTMTPSATRSASENPGAFKTAADAHLAKKKHVRKAKGGIKIEVMHEASQGGSSHVLLTNETEESLSNRRRHIMKELIETERLYVEELQSIMEGYATELGKAELAHLVPIALENNKDVLFGNLFEIYEFHNRTFRKELENCMENPELVGTCFLKSKEELQIYEKYCQNKPRSEALWRQCGDSAFFQECQKKLDHKLSLDAYLLKPVQRITKYQLMLKEMLKCSKSSEGAAQLEEALSTVLHIIKSVNDSMHQISITGFEGNLSELGKLLMQGSFSVWTDHKKGHAKVKDLARFKPMQRHLFLYSRMLLFCKRREEGSDSHEKTPSYSFKHSLEMSAIGITENVKGDSRKFEVWYNGREEVYIIQAPSTDVKNTWVSEMRKVLTEQLEACREARQLHQRAVDSAYHSPLNTSFSRTEGKAALKKSYSSSPETGSRRLAPSPSATQWSRGPSPRLLRTDRVFCSPKAMRIEITSDPTSLGLEGWTPRHRPSVDAEDFETVPSSTDEHSNSSDAEEDTSSKNKDGFCAQRDLSLRAGDAVQSLEEAEKRQWLVQSLVRPETVLVPPRVLLTGGEAHIYSNTDIFSDMCSAALTDSEEKEND